MIVFFTFVFFNVAVLINLYLIPAFFRSEQMVAGFLALLLLITVILGLCICTLTLPSYSDKARDFISSVSEDKSTRISEYEDKKERKDQEEKKAQEQKVNQKNETEWVCTIVDDQKICTRNQEKEAREDKTSDSDWDCVTEGSRKICIKHGAAKWD